MINLKFLNIFLNFRLTVRCEAFCSRHSTTILSTSGRLERPYLTEGWMNLQHAMYENKCCCAVMMCFNISGGRKWKVISIIRGWNFANLADFAHLSSIYQHRNHMEELRNFAMFPLYYVIIINVSCACCCMVVHVDHATLVNFVRVASFFGKKKTQNLKGCRLL